MRSWKTGVRFGVRCGPPRPQTLVNKGDLFGGEGRNRQAKLGSVVQLPQIHWHFTLARVLRQ